ncbi:pseudouridine synthase [Metamycoplasma equirhinis]|uniref:Pseudouridine synthase n=1 Tax=Metamycoplasma equirhinis TaxID=92402 RepID=A0ABZ0P9K7_9BACT|nr:pseudouridine synthase [Metamycoplasma equirhinis]TPD98743.1 rRNA pseudouridine synthase [Metamycoplasma equirhinis]WPB53719.1 pseudouridine synthase [Metamycoplasma equirhinis]
MPNSIKLQKYMSDCGFCSRRESEKLILQGKVFVNEELATIGQRILITDKVKVNNSILKLENKKLYILLNKPKNTICTLDDPQKRKTIYDHIKINKYLFSVGRLDFNTTGVILITNDGELANKLAHPSSKIERQYLVELEKKLSQDKLEFLNSKNVKLNGKISKQKVTKISETKYLISLYEGRNHHVKNLFLLVENYVKKLHRKSYGFLTDENLKIGEFRQLTETEISMLKNITNIK